MGGVDSTGTVSVSNATTTRMQYDAQGRDIDSVVIETAGRLTFTFDKGDINIRQLRTSVAGRKEPGWSAIGGGYTLTDGLIVNGSKILSKGGVKPLVRRARGFEVLVTNASGGDLEFTVDVYYSGGPGDEDLAEVTGWKRG